MPNLLPAAQGKDLNPCALKDKVTSAAWKTNPSWFVVSSNDQMIHPDVLRKAAEKINATTVTLSSSHVPMLSKPKDVSKVILEAAGIY